jgi:thiamine biosynthesis lipoprotein
MSSTTEYGPVQVRITVAGGKITKAEAVQAPSGGTSDQKTALAIPKLNQEAVAAGNATSTPCRVRRTRAAVTRSPCSRRWTRPVADTVTDPAEAPAAVRHAEEVMGTVFSFDIRGGEPEAVRAALEQAVAQLHRVNEVFSTYRDDSQVSRLARGELTVAECDPEVAEVLELGAEAERVSAGWFSTKYEGQLDPTGIVKGWAAERAAELIAAAAGVSGVSVNGGGDVQMFGTPGPHRPWRVGVSDPLRPAVSRPSSPRRAPTNWPWPPPVRRSAGRTSWTRRTGKSAVTDLVAVTVVAPV